MNARDVSSIDRKSIALRAHKILGFHYTFGNCEHPGINSHQGCYWRGIRIPLPGHRIQQSLWKSHLILREIKVLPMPEDIPGELSSVFHPDPCAFQREAGDTIGTGRRGRNGAFAWRGKSEPEPLSRRRLCLISTALLDAPHLKVAKRAAPTERNIHRPFASPPAGIP